MSNNKYTISEDYNTFLWLPARTASTTLSWIFTHFNFYTGRFEDEKFVREDNVIHHFGHVLLYPPNHRNMTFLYSTRHPYDRALSFYNAFGINRPDNQGFKWYFENFLMKEYSLYFQSLKIREDRIPDYFIRAEKMYEDLLKIPFIKNSKLHKCGLLEDMCKRKLNSSDPNESENFLTPEIKDTIYKTFKKQFDLFGYSK